MRMPAAVIPSRFTHLLTWLVVALAAALVVLWLRYGEPSFGDDRRIGNAVGVDFYEASGRRLNPGDTLVSGAVVGVAYRNEGVEGLSLLAFAIDSARTIHWLAPTKPRQQQEASVGLAPSAVERVLPQRPTLDELPAGPVTLVGLVTRTPVFIGRVEHLVAAERNPEGLRDRFPDSLVVAVSLDSAGPPGGAGTP